METNLQPYVDIQHTMNLMRVQIVDSLQFAKSWLAVNEINTIDELFYKLLQETTFQHDPKDTELLQSMQTLMTANNYHGLEGAGDCDCFVIAITACALVKGWFCEIVLAGRNNRYPVHIYNRVELYVFDLTEKVLGRERYYKWTQTIEVSPKLLYANTDKEFIKFKLQNR